MQFKTFGNRKNKTIVLLHGGGLSWWSYQELIEKLQEQFCVLSVIIDGHGDDAKRPFESIEDSATQLLRYIQQEFSGQVHACVGLSLGAQIIVEMLSRDKNWTEFAVVESALVLPVLWVQIAAPWMIRCTFPLIRQKWFAKMQAKALFVPSSQFALYYKDSLKISKISLINIAKSNARYSLKKSIAQTNAKVLIIAGEKEVSGMKKSAQLLHETIPESELFIAPKMKHGEWSMVHFDLFFDQLLHFLNSKRSKDLPDILI